MGFAVQQFLIDNEHDESEWQDQLCVTFPWIQYADEIMEDNGKVKDSFTFSSFEKNKSKSKKSTPQPIVLEERPCYILRTKYRAIQTKGLQRILPKGGSWGFFGWHLTRSAVESTATSDDPSGDKPTPKQSKHHKSIIITEGEYDAMAVSQGLHLSCKANDSLLKIPCISLPNGCNSLPNELVSMLDQYQNIYLWMDNDKSGQNAIEKFTRKLGIGRCLIVSPSPDMTVSDTAALYC